MHEKFGISNKSFHLIIEALKSFPEINQALIFGSRAMGNFKPGSDIDIVLKGKINQTLLAEIKANLDEEIATPYLFDVVDYDSIDNKNLVKHINDHGVIIYDQQNRNNSN